MITCMYDIGKDKAFSLSKEFGGRFMIEEWE